jgi:serine/threonine-protein kinase
MKCVKCGAPLDQGARFCGGCGEQQPGAVIPHAAVRTNAKTIFQGSGGASPFADKKPGPAGAPPSASAKDDLGYASTIAPPSSQRPAAAPAPAAARPAPAAAPKPKPAPRGAPLGDLTGQTINNRYLVEGKLGEGGFGAVYKAKQTQMNRLVALKVLHPAMAKDAQVVGRFKREAQASSLLRAPHTVQVYDFDQTPEGMMFLAMEMLQGKSLHQILQDEGPLEPMRLVKVMDGIADSLGEAHTQGIVHRDIKPENIYLEPRPTPDFVKVLDFGIAKIVSGDGLASQGPALTAAGQTLGTLEYMSPEQLMGQPLDGRSDLYALGILAFEMLTGRLPFEARTPGDMITAHLKKVPPPPSSVAPERNIPPTLDQVLARLLEKQRDKRYKDTAELRDALARVGSAPAAVAPTPVAAPAPAAPAPVAARAPSPPRSAAGEPTDRVELAQQPGGSRLGLLVGIIVAVAAVAGGLIYFLTSK